MIAWPDTFAVTYTYDGLNRVTQVANGGTIYRNYTYDVLLRRGTQVAMPGTNSTTTTYAYEIDNDLATLTHNYPGATTDLVYTSTYSAAHQVLSTTTSEALNRYSPGVPLGTQAYAAANPLNQYPSVTPIGGSAVTLSYDLNGNLTGDGASTYTYDATNRLLAVSGLFTASYGYDALDRRTEKTASTITTRFLHAGSDEIAEYSSSGTLLRRYVPAPGTDERAVLVDSGLLNPPATALRFPHTDRQGSVVSVTDNTGAVSERFSYDAYGKSNSPMSGYPFRFTGQRLDSETGLMFYKARVYSQALGRFLQTDPMGTKDSLNLYAYVRNDPLNGTDPTGAESSWEMRWAAQAEMRQTLEDAGYGDYYRGPPGFSVAQQKAVAIVLLNSGYGGPEKFYVGSVMGDGDMMAEGAVQTAAMIFLINPTRGGGGGVLGAVERTAAQRAFAQVDRIAAGLAERRRPSVMRSRLRSRPRAVACRPR